MRRQPDVGVSHASGRGERPSSAHTISVVTPAGTSAALHSPWPARADARDHPPSVALQARRPTGFSGTNFVAGATSEREQDRHHGAERERVRPTTMTALRHHRRRDARRSDGSRHTRATRRITNALVSRSRRRPGAQPGDGHHRHDRRRDVDQYERRGGRGRRRERLGVVVTNVTVVSTTSITKFTVAVDASLGTHRHDHGRRNDRRPGLHRHRRRRRRPACAATGYRRHGVNAAVPGRTSCPAQHRSP